jgi:hypothetical protein
MSIYENVRKILNRDQTSSLTTKRVLKSAFKQITDNVPALATYNTYTAAQGSSITTLADGATVVADLSAGNVFELTLGGNRTIDFQNPTAGQEFTLYLSQDATGTRLVTWDSVNDWAGGTDPTLTVTANAVDVLRFYVDSGGNIHGNHVIADSK